MQKPIDDIDSLNRLKREYEDIILRIDTTNLLLNELSQQIVSQEASQHYLELAEQDSRKIAEELENRAITQADEILFEVELVVASRKTELLKVEAEIALLLSVNEAGDNNDLADISFVAEDKKHTDVHGNSLDHYIRRQKTSLDDSIYNMKLVSFINARHFVTFGGKAGPVHAHSWQVEVEVEVPRKTEETIEFTKVFKAVTGALGVYENTVLNQVYPFNLIQPTTENIAMYAYNRVDAVLSTMHLKLVHINLWETPTRGINVTNHNILLDEQIRLAAQDQEASNLEAAASFDLSFDQDDVKKPEPEIKTSRVFPQISIGPLRPAYAARQYFLAVVVILAVAVLAYHNILWPSLEQRYPWGSDSWGHLFKAEMLYQQILKGNFYPQFTEYWYNGIQPFRYWAPLPYYLLALLRAVSGDVFTAGNLYIFICVLFGALSWLFLSRKMGLWPSIFAALIWLLWQDNVRVAFSEGNLPRVLATALLPLLFALFLHVLANKKQYPAIIATIILIQLVVLCHAMIAAVYCICLALFGFFLWVFQGIDIKRFMEGILVLMAGLASSCWWLLPSLSGGGIAAIDSQAVKEIMQFVAAGISLNPIYRFTNVETFYWGIALILALLVSIISWKSKPAWAKSLIVCGFILVLITFPIVRGIYISLPLSHLLWPLRFSSFAALAILAAGFTFNLEDKRQHWLKSPYINGLLIITLFVFLIADCLLSFSLLAHTGTMPYNVIQSGDYIKQKPGWRVATIDLSQLGSAPSYTFSELAGLEQVFGWAWQGAVTSKNIMLLNTGLEQQYYPFLFRSCVDLGATDLVVKEDVVTDIEDFRRAAAMAGYKLRNKFKDISVWRNVDEPYLVAKQASCLVIGKYAGTIGIQFPDVEMGRSTLIDQYSLSELQNYSQVILSGASWKTKKAAEKLISDYAASGGKVFIEMAGMPENVLAKQPEFLGVYGETVGVRGNIEVWGKDSRFTLPPIWQQAGEWRAYVPMDLDKVELEFSYYGNQAPILGYKLIKGHKVWFLGYNLSYHTFLSGTPSESKLLSDILGLSTSYTSSRLIPLQDYEASEKGYRMSYRLEQERQVIVPVSALEGISAKIDGAKVKTANFENLLELKLPAGQHRLEIIIEKTPVYDWGKYLSLLTILIVLSGLLYLKRAGDSK